MSMVTEFVINRSRWLRGEGGEKSYLLRESDGKMCCLGMLLQACGFTDDELREKSHPGAVVSDKPIAGWLLDMTLMSQTTRLIDSNDETEMSEDAREWRIAELFKGQGITVTFQD